MVSFFDRFPQIPYDFDKIKNKPRSTSSRVLITDIFFRIAFLKIVREQNADYTEYVIREGETPEMLADKFYGDSEAHWIILFFNNIVDPFYDWPLEIKPFYKYIRDKYGSIADAQTTYHHYEKTIIRTIEHNGQASNTVFTHSIDRIGQVTDFDGTYPTIPYDSYISTPAHTIETRDSQYGTQIIIDEETSRVTNFDWEHEQNEKKRKIRILSVNYYRQIKNEFEELISQYNPDFRLGLKSARI